jgi:transposase
MERLTYREHHRLEDLAVQTTDARILRRAQALLWADKGESPEAVSERLGVSQRTIYYWHDRFQMRRGLDLRTRLADGTRSGRPRTALEIIEPLLEAVLDQEPRRLGYRATVWTAPLLPHYRQEVHDLGVSRPSGSVALGRLRVRWKRPRPQLALRAPRWRQAKGGSNGGSRSGSARLS